MDPKAVEPVTDYKNADTVFQVNPLDAGGQHYNCVVCQGCQLYMFIVDVY